MWGFDLRNWLFVLYLFGLNFELIGGILDMDIVDNCVMLVLIVLWYLFDYCFRLV